jgi:AcrR family transcriptional regulator
MDRSPAPAAEGRRPRRSPTGAERQRDAERTREKLLDAALEEFAAKGFAGARVAEIAARAGVNQQLVGYYFGGKQGLYDELLARWRTLEEQVAAPERPLADVIRGYLQAAADNPHWTRLLAWQSLTGQADREHDDSDVRAAVEDLRARQARGEIAADLDVEALVVVHYAAASAPVLLRDVVEDACGAASTSPEVLDRLAGLLERLVQPPSQRGQPSTAATQPGH